MNTKYDDELNDELRDEYDFSQMTGGVRGKYTEQYHEGVKLIMLEPDVAKMFPDAKSVNEALSDPVPVGGSLTPSAKHHRPTCWSGATPSTNPRLCARTGR